jgi:hypothetical protein
MKKLFLGALFCATILFAGAQQPGEHHRFNRSHHHMDISAKLNFSNEQKEQLKSINATFKQKMQDLNQHDDITVREMRNQRAALVNDHKKAVEDLLTPAQKDQLKQWKEKGKERMAAMSQKRIDRLKKTIDLTDAQAAQLKTESENFHQKMLALHEDKSLSPQDKRSKSAALREEHKQAMNQVFTKEQKEKLEQFHKNRQQKDEAK